ncbi:hypothetical protein OLL98_01200 [Enterococcus faecalis]|nr:hypothetical protein OLL98_01200 [Enterococcus faecalis]
MEFITQFINDLGNFIFIPLIFLVFMVALGRPLAEAIQSAMKVGIGFIALSMVIGFMLEKDGTRYHWFSWKNRIFFRCN